MPALPASEESAEALFRRRGGPTRPFSARAQTIAISLGYSAWTEHALPHATCSREPVRRDASASADAELRCRTPSGVHSRGILVLRFENFHVRENLSRRDDSRLGA